MLWHHALSSHILILVMGDVTLILEQIESGDSSAAEDLLPLVYDELRRLAAARMAQESADHMLQATALVHEAYVRLVDTERAQDWRSRGHFFAAAAEAMRRILIDHARQRNTRKRGGGARDVHVETCIADTPLSLDEMLDFEEALGRLESSDPQAADIVELRVFAGLTVEEAADSLGVPVRSAYRDWAFAKAWLFRELNPGGE